MFDNLFFYPFVDRIMRSKASVRSRIFDVFVMRVLVKRYVYEFIGGIYTKSCMVLCELNQDWF